MMSLQQSGLNQDTQEGKAPQVALLIFPPETSQVEQLLWGHACEASLPLSLSCLDMHSKQSPSEREVTI